MIRGNNKPICHGDRFRFLSSVDSGCLLAQIILVSAR